MGLGCTLTSHTCKDYNMAFSVAATKKKNTLNMNSLSANYTFSMFSKIVILNLDNGMSGFAALSFDRIFQLTACRTWIRTRNLL